MCGKKVGLTDNIDTLWHLLNPNPWNGKSNTNDRKKQVFRKRCLNFEKWHDVPGRHVGRYWKSLGDTKLIKGHREDKKGRGLLTCVDEFQPTTSPLCDKLFLHTHIHTYTQTYIYTYTHTHMCRKKNTLFLQIYLSLFFSQTT